MLFYPWWAIEWMTLEIHLGWFFRKLSHLSYSHGQFLSTILQLAYFGFSYEKKNHIFKLPVNLKSQVSHGSNMALTIVIVPQFILHGQKGNNLTRCCQGLNWLCLISLFIKMATELACRFISIGRGNEVMPQCFVMPGPRQISCTSQPLPPHLVGQMFAVFQMCWFFLAFYSVSVALWCL